MFLDSSGTYFLYLIQCSFSSLVSRTMSWLYSWNFLQPWYNLSSSLTPLSTYYHELSGCLCACSSRVYQLPCWVASLYHSCFVLIFIIPEVPYAKLTAQPSCKESVYKLINIRIRNPSAIFRSFLSRRHRDHVPASASAPDPCCQTSFVDGFQILLLGSYFWMIGTTTGRKIKYKDSGILFYISKHKRRKPDHD